MNLPYSLNTANIILPSETRLGSLDPGPNPSPLTYIHVLLRPAARPLAAVLTYCASLVQSEMLVRRDLIVQIRYQIHTCRTEYMAVLRLLTSDPWNLTLGSWLHVGNGLTYTCSCMAGWGPPEV
jgi:hypothetical protein